MRLLQSARRSAARASRLAPLAWATRGRCWRCPTKRRSAASRGTSISRGLSVRETEAARPARRGAGALRRRGPARGRVQHPRRRRPAELGAGHPRPHRRDGRRRADRDRLRHRRGAATALRAAHRRNDRPLLHPSGHPPVVRAGRVARTGRPNGINRRLPQGATSPRTGVQSHSNAARIWTSSIPAAPDPGRSRCFPVVRASSRVVRPRPSREGRP